MSEHKPYNIVEENDFDKLEEQARLAAEAAKEVTYKQAEFDKAVQEAFENGVMQGQRDALTTQEERVAKSFEKLVVEFDRLISLQAASEAVQEKETLNIATAIVRKIMPRFIELHGTQEVSALIQRALRNNITVKELNIFVHPTIMDDLKGRLTTFVEENGYKDRINFKEDADIPAGDCKLDWGIGGVTRVVPNLWSEIEAQIIRLLNGEPIEDYLNAGPVYESTKTTAEKEPAFINTAPEGEINVTPEAAEQENETTTSKPDNTETQETE